MPIVLIVDRKRDSRRHGSSAVLPDNVRIFEEEQVYVRHDG